MTGINRRVWAMLLALVFLFNCAPEALAAEAAATTVQLTKTEGTVSVTNRSGRALSLIEKMRVYSGYHLTTEKASYAWLTLDRTKLCKLDAVSELEVRKSGKKLELLLGEGNLFFDVTEPLDDDESLNIRTSTMTVGIRGTCGWVKSVDQWTSRVYVLEGAVQTAVSDPVTGEVKTETIPAGESAVCKVYPQEQTGGKCEIIRDDYAASEIDGFVLTEAVPDETLCGKIYEASGLDLRDYPEDPAERLRQDQASVDEKLAVIEEQVQRQETTIAAEPLWADPTPDPAPAANPPSPPAPLVSPDGGNSGGSGGVSTSTSVGGGGSSGGSSSSTPNPPSPPAPARTVTLTMPQEDNTVDSYLARSTVSGVILRPASARASTANLLEVDSGITVPGGKTLTLQTGVSLEVLAGQNLNVAGTMTMDGGYLNAGGDIAITGQAAVKGDFSSGGTVAVSGRLSVDGYFSASGGVYPSASSVVRAKQFGRLANLAPGWQVSAAKDDEGYFVLERAQAAGTYTVTFNANGGAVTPASVSTRADGTVTALPEPDPREGYVFDGWFTAATGGTEVTDGTVFNRDTTVYAHWTPVADVEWKVEGGILYINGTGAMKNYDNRLDVAPWKGKSFTKAVIGDGITSVGSNSFRNCAALQNVTIPTGVNSIGAGAFKGCSSLTDVTIPNGVKRIDSYAFQNCGALESMTIPGSVTDIADCAFQSCTSLKNVTIPTGVKIIARNTFDGCSGLQSVTIPSTVTEIDDYAFAVCKSLTEITIPDSVISIGESAFQRCGLQSVTIPNSVQSIEYGAFQECGSLQSATLSSGAASISDRMFTSCVKLQSVTIPSGVTSIGDGAFENCRDLTSVNLPNTISAIGKGAFYQCASLESMTIPGGVTSISDHTFAECKNLQSVTILGDVTGIGVEAFKECYKLTDVTIPRSVTSIGTDAFTNCIALTTVNYDGTEAEWNAIGDKDNTGILSVKYLWKSAGNLYWKGQGTQLRIRGTGEMENYSSGAAPWGKAFTTAVVENGVTGIGDYAFWGCFKLTSVTIPASVTGIGDYAFHGCQGLTGVTIPDSVTSIGASAFSGCYGLTGVTIPDKVTSISNFTFNGCSGLTSVTIPDSVTSIGDSAFDGCSLLKSVTIPDSVTSIGASAFNGCSLLKSVTIPDSVTSIGASAFNGCGKLADVYYGGTAEDWGNIAIDATGNDDLTGATITYNSPTSHAGRLVRTAVRCLASAAPGYVDVPDGAWYAEAAAYCREHGLMIGTGAGRFSPDSGMTRAMMVTALYRLAGRPVPSPEEPGKNFPDVKAGTWYAEAVSWAGRARIVLGYPDGRFGPDNPVSHEQAELILRRYSGDPTLRLALAGEPKSPATRAGIAAALADFAKNQTLAPGALSVYSAMNIMCGPSGIAPGRDGSLLVTDVYNKQIWRVLNRDSESYAGGATMEDLYGRPVGGYNDAGLDNSYFKEPWAIAPFLDGWAVSDRGNNAVRLIQANSVETINGATSEKLKITELGVSFDGPTGLAADGAGNLYVSDTFSGAVRRITPKGGVSTAAVGLTEPTGLCWKDGALYIAETGANRVLKLQDGKLGLVAGSGEAALTDGAAAEAAFSGPQGVAVGDDGSVYVADTGNGAIRRVKNGTVTTLAARDMAQAEFGLTSPVGLLVQGEKLYICDSFARKVFVLRIG